MLNVNKRVGQKIKELRKKARLSQEQLSLKASVNKSFMGKIERGEVSPTLNTLEKMVNALEVDLKDLFHSKNFKENEDVNFYTKIILDEISNKSLKEQQAIFKLIKTFFNLVNEIQNFE